MRPRQRRFRLRAFQSAFHAFFSRIWSMNAGGRWPQLAVTAGGWQLGTAGGKDSSRRAHVGVGCRIAEFVPK